MGLPGLRIVRILVPDHPVITEGIHQLVELGKIYRLYQVTIGMPFISFDHIRLRG
jgi:hypothetical protein